MPATGFGNTTLAVTVGEEADPSGWPTNGRATWWASDGTLRWKLRGATVETIRQTFMFMGFQFIGVSGWPAAMPPPTAASMRGVPTSTLTKERHQVGELTFAGVAPSANIAASYGTPPPHPTAAPKAAAAASGQGRARGKAKLLDGKILAGVFHLIIWGQVSNLQAIPSDCPNREKRGWMGDAANGAMQAVANFDMAAVYRSWVRSMLDDQARNTRNTLHKRAITQNATNPSGSFS